MKKPDPSIDAEIAKQVQDAWSQRFPNDALEVFVIVAMLAFVSAGAYFMWLLSQGAA